MSSQRKNIREITRKITDPQKTDSFAGRDDTGDYQIEHQDFMKINNLDSYGTITGTNAILTEDGKTTTASAIAALASGETVTTKTGNYTITDGDGVTFLALSGASGDSAFTLPTLADNQDRILTLYNFESSYVLTIDGEGSETISGVPTIELPTENNFIKIIGTSGEWKVISEDICCQLRLDTHAGYGSTDTKIVRFTNSRENFGNMFSENHSTGYNSNAEGLEITINKTGKYFFMFTSFGPAGASIWGLSLNSTELTTDINLITDADSLCYQFADNNQNSSSSNSWSGCLKKGDIVRAHARGETPALLGGSKFTASYLGS